MSEYSILYIGNDLKKHKVIISQLQLPSDIKFIFSNDGTEAIKVALNRHIDLIILSDNFSKPMRGEDICNTLLSKQCTTNIPIIILGKVKYTDNCTNIISDLNTPASKEELEKEILTEYKKVKNIEDLQQNKDLIISIVNHINAPIFIISNNKITFTNNYFLQFFEISSIEDFHHIYPNLQDIFINKKKVSKFSFFRWLKKLFNAQNGETITIQNRSGKKMILKVDIISLKHQKKYLFVTQDVTAEQNHAKELENIYYTDQLTKLPNRLKLIQEIQKCNKLALAVIDIDSFKVINDFYGHIIGDFIICEVAKRILEYISHENLSLYRLPSDKFALLNKGFIDEDYFEIIVLSIVKIISQKPFIYKNNNKDIEIHVSVTTGIVYEKKLALAHADLALRDAKSTHQEYVVYQSKMQQEQVYKNNMEWVQKIKIAINNDKIVPYFQPIVNNITKKVEKYECLVRLIDEKDKVIAPIHFLEIAKHSKHYESITKIMIKKSFQTFISNHYSFSINLSIEDITDYNLFEYIKNMLSIYPLANRVCFEILETEKIENYQTISNFVTEVKSLGCKVSIDDFGSGYSNFSHLLNINFDYLKIDASLIKDIHTNIHKQIIVKTIVAFAKELNIQTIGEYVESKEIYEYITRMGVDYSQGYYFSPPVEIIS